MADSDDFSPKDARNKSHYYRLPTELKERVFEELPRDGGNDAVHQMASFGLVDHHNASIFLDRTARNPVFSLSPLVERQHFGVLKRELSEEKPNWANLVEQVGPTLKAQRSKTKSDFVDLISGIPEQSAKMEALGELAPYQKDIQPHAKKLLNEAVNVFCERQPSKKEFTDTTREEQLASYFIAHGDAFLNDKQRDKINEVIDEKHMQFDGRRETMQQAHLETSPLTEYDAEFSSEIREKFDRERMLANRDHKTLERDQLSALSTEDPDLRTKLVAENGETIATQFSKGMDLRRKQLMERERSGREL